MTKITVIKVEAKEQGFTKSECENIVSMIRAQLPNTNLDIRVE